MLGARVRERTQVDWPRSMDSGSKSVVVVPSATEPRREIAYMREKPFDQGRFTGVMRADDRDVADASVLCQGSTPRWARSGPQADGG